MKLRRRETRSEGETIVAMIDVVFFLLVFFMLVGRMDATAPFALEIPLAEGGAPLPHGGAIIS
ncbi:MAG: biopolymer transporter ExbD, partial [Pseudomonadota bacterium]